jgi:TMEM175 potassium channel family protein
MRYPRDGNEFNRAIGFFDATYALALTLLVTTLDIDDPTVAFRSLSALDAAVGAQFFAFVIAFWVIASYWLANHRMVASFAAIDMRAIIVHLWLIAAVVLLPFTTNAVGNPDVEDLALPTVLMAVSIVAVSTLHTLLYVVAYRDDLLDPKPTPTVLRATAIAAMAPAAVFLISIPITYVVSPSAARLTWLLLIVAQPVAGRVASRAG